MTRHHSLSTRFLALSLAFLTLLWGACVPNDPISPYTGVLDFVRINLVAVPGGFVNTAGGNLMVGRADMSLDTPLGTQEIGAVYNSTSGEWLWNFQISYDGARFVDPTGFVIGGVTPESGLLTPNGTISGTVWVRVDAATIKTKGGLAYHFAADGTLSYISWATMDYPRIEFTPIQISQCTQASACAPLFNLSLNSDGNPLSITDARTGRVAQFSYDGLGRLVTAKNPFDVAEGGAGTTYEYSMAGTLLTAMNNSEGERIEYSYQAERRILHVTQIGEGNPRHRFEFYGRDAAIARRPVVHTNPLGGETRYFFDDSSKLREIELSASGETTRLTYGDTHLAAVLRVSSITLPNGANTSFTVDADDDVVQMIDAAGNVIQTTYASNALNFENVSVRAFQRIEDTLGLVEDRTYDALGRVASQSNGEGEMITFTYAPASLATATLPSGVEFSFPVYGSHGHWLKIAGAAVDRRAFDAIGNVVAPGAGSQEGGILTLSYDPNRVLNGLNMAASEAGTVTSQASITIRNRSDRQMLEVQRPGGADHQMIYDTLGRLVERKERVDGVWQSTRFERDLAGNRTAVERPNGMREEFEYDAYGRLTRRSALRDGVPEGEVSFGYEDGELRFVTDASRGGTEVWAHDNAGRVQTITYPGGESLTVEYDLRSRRTVEIYAMPSVGTIQRIDYEYDLANRQTRILSNNTEVLVERAFVDGDLETASFGNGLSRSFQYEGVAGKLIATTTVDAAAAVIEASSITRESLANPARFVVTTETTTTAAATLEEYSMGVGGSLSNPDLLVGKRVWAWSNDQGDSKAFVYDELSNMLSNNDGDTFSYNLEWNRLQSASLAHEGELVGYTYDEAGFVDSRNGVVIEWTATGRLATYGTTNLSWDMQDRLIAMMVDGTTRDFSRFGGRIESDPTTGTPIALDLGSVMISLVSAQRAYRHLDFRGNVSFVSDETGQVVSHYRYSPYGVDAIFGSGTDTVSFVGRPEVGDLMLLGERVYDPLVGRFLSPDPVFQAINQYAYTLGNPVWYWDPDGADAGRIAVLVVTAMGLTLLATAAIVPATATVVVLGTTVGVVKLLVASGGALLATAAWGGLVVEIFRVDPCNTKCKSPPFPEGALFQGGPATDLFFFAGPSEAGRSGTAGAGGGAGGDYAPAPAPSCSPASLQSVPNLGWTLSILLPVQILLGLIILRRRSLHGGVQ